MKRILIPSLLLIVAQLQAAEAVDRSKLANSETCAIAQRGADYRVWERTVNEAGPGGQASPVVHRYTELATGMHYQDESGQWVESSPQIELLPNSDGAVARRGQHKVIFPPDLYSGQIELNTPDGKWMRSQVMGLGYFNTANGQSVMIAVVTNSIGELAASNVVVYPNAFTGLEADVRYTYTRGGFEQDVILRQQPPSPGDYGLDPATTRLQVLTEFLEAPQPKINRYEQKGFADELLDFGAMKIGPGKAFTLEDDGGTNQVRSARNRVPVGKQWLRLEGRTFLVEEVEFKQVESKLGELPAAPVAVNRSSLVPGSMLHRVVSGRALPAPRLARKSNGIFRVAGVKASSKPGFVLDYVAFGGATDYTFRGDTTYYVSGEVGLSGRTTFEGGAVIKLNGSGQLNVNSGSTVVCKTGPYRPIIFTSKNDDTMGEGISGSSGSPGNSDVNCFLNLGTGVTLRNMRFNYGLYPIITGNNLEVWDSQFLGTYFAVTFWGSTMGLHNVLLNQTAGRDEEVLDCGAADGSSVLVENATAADCHGFVATFGADVTQSIINSINTRSGSVWISGGDWMTATSAIFQPFVGGKYYLTNNSPYRNIGTTNITAALAAGLKLKTTFAPQGFYTNVIANNLALSATVGRDTDQPDIGYHYDPIDYVVACVVSNATLTLTNGVALAYGGTIPFETVYSGIELKGTANLVSQGTPDRRNYVVYYRMAQESSIFSAQNRAILNTLYDNVLSTNRGDVTLRFTSIVVPQQTGGIFGYLKNRNLTLRDCEIYSYYNGSVLWQSNSYVFQNNLFVYPLIDLESSGSLINCNNLYVGAPSSSSTVTFLSAGSGSWTNRDNVFDGCYSDFNGTKGYNAYVNGTDHPATNLLELTDITNGPNSVIWTTGPLGDYYQPANSPLINAGSRTADWAGLYHFTTLSNQVKEANSVVDIGYHYLAVGTNGLPLDTDGDEISDYLEDPNGNGIVDTGETDYLNGNLSVTNGLRLWLKADAVGGTNATGSVTNWLDQSGHSNHASQSVSANRPSFVINAVNGLPVVHFDPTSANYFTLPTSMMNGVTQAQAFVVLKATLDQPTGPGTYRCLWSFGNGPNAWHNWYPSREGTNIYEDFGSADAHYMGDPPQPLDQYHIYEVAAATNYWAVWFNGVIQRRTYSNAVSFIASPRLGRNDTYGDYFAGDVAEILIFDRVLSGSERTTVQTHLNSKYGLIPQFTTTPTNLTATAVSPTQISLNWRTALFYGATRFSIERRVGADAYVEVAQVTNAFNYVDTNLQAVTTYSYRVRAINISFWSDYSNEAEAETPLNGGSIPLNNLLLWLRTDSGFYQFVNSTNPVISFWPDQSVMGNDARVDFWPTPRPTFITNSLNGLPVVHFNPTNTNYFSFPTGMMNGVTQAQAFVVLKATLDQPTGPGTYRCLWSFGNGPNAWHNWYPSREGTNIYEDFGSKSAHNLGDPAQPLDQYHVYEVAAATNYWAGWVNGVLRSQAYINAVSFIASPRLGRNDMYGDYFAGDVAEILIFNRTLLESERMAVASYLYGKYDLPSTNDFYSFPVQFTAFPDTDGDGTNDLQEIIMATDPTTSNNWALPPSDPSDHTPPDVILTEPASPPLLP